MNPAGHHTEAERLAHQSLNGERLDTAERVVLAHLAQVHATLAGALTEARVIELVQEAMTAHREADPHIYADGSTY